MRAEIIFGVHESNTDNRNVKVPIEEITKTIQEIVKENQTMTGMDIRGTLEECRMIFRKDYGCAEDGETAFKYIAIYNSAETPMLKSSIDWDDAVRNLACLIRKKFKRITVSLEFIRSEFYHVDYTMCEEEADRLYKKKIEEEKEQAKWKEY